MDPTCVSPSQNLDSAYLSGAKGCPCREEIDEGVCLPDSKQLNVALICVQGTWLAVEDGPCWPMP